MEPSGQFTRLLLDLRAGDRAALELLTPMVYDELRRLAGALFGRERSGHTLQATALVHEAWIKLSGDAAVPWQTRAHFLAVAAKVMRHILIDYSRGHKAAKRGSGNAQVTLEEGLVYEPERSPEVLALNDALDELAKLDPRKARIVEMRYFGGLTGDEIAEVEGIGTATVTRDLRMAQAWLAQRMTEGAATAAGSEA